LNSEDIKTKLDQKFTGVAGKFDGLTDVVVSRADQVEEVINRQKQDLRTVITTELGEAKGAIEGAREALVARAPDNRMKAVKNRTLP
ncbi:hypothetical protein ACUWCL_29245, partial [Klebsiella pneumoniae]|uniref:hypothetical protein n=1 Tax=Klebsiella pneumoniae TaxID=573 RepID=UPI0040556F8A